MADHNDLGRQGEAIAEKFLKKKGFSVLVCNWQLNRHEVDIIAIDKEFLVFIEVKTRSNLKYGYPDEAVDFKKEKMLIEAAEMYLEKENLMYEVRFDIVSVLKNESEEKIFHIIDAFQG